RDVAIPPPPKAVAQELRVQRGGRKGRAPELHALAHHAPAELVEERRPTQLRAALVQYPIEDVTALDGMPDASILPHPREKLFRLVGGLHVGAELRVGCRAMLSHGGDRLIVIPVRKSSTGRQKFSSPPMGKEL